MNLTTVRPLMLSNKSPCRPELFVNLRYNDKMIKYFLKILYHNLITPEAENDLETFQRP